MTDATATAEPAAAALPAEAAPLIHHHITPVTLYYKIFGLLMVLTVVTVLISRIDLGFMNIVMAVTIATIKATVVALFFMHLKYSAKVTWVAAAAGVIWLCVMLALTLADVLSRTWIPTPEAWL